MWADGPDSDVARLAIVVRHTGSPCRFCKGSPTFTILQDRCLRWGPNDGFQVVSFPHPDHPSACLNGVLTFTVRALVRGLRRQGFRRSVGGCRVLGGGVGWPQRDFGVNLAAVIGKSATCTRR